MDVTDRSIDPSLLAAARRAIERHGWEGTTLERIAAEAGISRMTLHRRGVDRHTFLAALAAELAAEHRAAMWPALMADGTGAERLRLALEQDCDLAERNLALIEALSNSSHAAVFHEEGDNVLSRAVFTEPLRRLLIDGIADGTIRDCDVDETATVLFNLVGLAYRHLRTGHGWDPERARAGVIDIALRGVVA